MYLIPKGAYTQLLNTVNKPTQDSMKAINIRQLNSLDMPPNAKVNN